MPQNTCEDAVEVEPTHQKKKEADSAPHDVTNAEASEQDHSHEHALEKSDHECLNEAKEQDIDKAAEEAEQIDMQGKSSQEAAVPPSILLSSAVVAVTPSRMLSSVVVAVTPSMRFSSVAVAVTPSRMLSSAADDVTVVPPNDKDGILTRPEFGL